MLCRIHQSGNLSQLLPESFEMVQNGLKIYKEKLVPVIPKSIPFFPLGMPSLQDTIHPAAVGLKTDNASYVAAWRFLGNKEVFIPFRKAKVNLIYPTNLNIKLNLLMEA
jgi:alpha-galactosidase